MDRIIEPRGQVSFRCEFRWGMVCALGVLLWSGAAIEAQGLKLDEEAPSGGELPMRERDERIARLRAEVERWRARGAELDGEDASYRQAIAASVRVREVALRLLESTTADPATSWAMMSAVTLHERAAVLDGLWDEAAAWAAGQPVGVKDEVERAVAADGVRRAMERLTGGSGPEPVGQAGDVRDASVVRGYLRRWLGVGLEVAARIEGPEGRPASVWPVTGESATALKPTLTDRLAGLEERMRAVARMRRSAEKIVELSAAIRPGLRFAELGPEARSAVAVLESAGSLAGVTDSADWLSEASAASIDQATLRALEAFGRPERDRRAAGARMVEWLSAWERAIRGVSSLARRKLGVTEYRAALEASIAAMEDESRATASRSVALWVGEATAWMDRLVPAMKDAATAGDAWRVAAQGLVRAGEGADRAAREAAAAMAGDPTSANHPAASAAVSALGVAARDLEWVVLLPGLVLEAQRMGADPPHGITARLRAAAQKLLTADRERAAGEIREFARQARRYVPGVMERGQGNEGGWTGELSRAADRQRSAWATAWARGAVPSDAARHMEPMRRLFDRMRDLARSERVTGGTAGLNHWAAMELPEGVLRQLGGNQSQGLRRAATLAIEGKMAEAEATLDEVDREKPVSLLLARWSAAIGPALGGGEPATATQVLRQVMEDPEPGCYQRGRESGVAALCRAIMELAHPGLRDDPDGRQALRSRVLAMAQPLWADEVE